MPRPSPSGSVTGRTQGPQGRKLLSRGQSPHLHCSSYLSVLVKPYLCPPPAESATGCGQALRGRRRLSRAKSRLDPSIYGAVPTAAQNCLSLTWNAVRQALSADSAPNCLRMAFHDAGTYNTATDTGG